MKTKGKIKSQTKSNIASLIGKVNGNKTSLINKDTNNIYDSIKSIDLDKIQDSKFDHFKRIIIDINELYRKQQLIGTSAIERSKIDSKLNSLLVDLYNEEKYLEIIDLRKKYSTLNDMKVKMKERFINLNKTKLSCLNVLNEGLTFNIKESDDLCFTDKSKVNERLTETTDEESLYKNLLNEMNSIHNTICQQRKMCIFTKNKIKNDFYENDLTLEELANELIIFEDNKVEDIKPNSIISEDKNKQSLSKISLNVILISIIILLLFSILNKLIVKALMIW